MINPRQVYRHYALQTELAHLIGKKSLMTTVQLPIVAALTPDHYDITIIDEDQDDPLPEGRPDLVALTAITATSRRAFEIADNFRAQGVPVVMGGSFATFSAEEAAEHADAVVCGAAELTWPAVLQDFETGRLGGIYRQDRFVDINESPRPRWDLVDLSRVMSAQVRATSGCPYSCEFCVVPELYGRKMTFRDADEVAAEIESLPIRMLNFVDDNLTINKRYAHELMSKLKPLNVGWVCQSSLDVADDEELLNEMADAGCIYILIGFESVNPNSLAETGKRHNDIAKYEEAVRKIHAAGIQIIASFVIGFDSDTDEDFEHIVEFTQRNALSFIMLHMLTPVKGTRLYDRMEAEGRVCIIDEGLVNGAFPTMRYMNFSLTEMLEKYYATVARFYDWRAVRERALRLFGNGAFRRDPKGDIGLKQKFRSFINLLRAFLLTTQPEKRRLFLDLFTLGRRRKLSMGTLVLFLLTMEGFRNNLHNTEADRRDWRRRLAEVDAGPWRDHTISDET
jgi:radical SAM superfamily enzyme YgiQ (UPF0313 family)